MEERLVTQAGAGIAPRLTCAGAARALGAELAQLEETLAGGAQEIQDHHPERPQLTADQSAAVLSVLTDGKRVSVINAPAGSGKTRVMTEAARVWAAAGRTMPRGRRLGEAAGAGRGRGARIAAALGLGQL